jgi:multidrug efflux pump subunit AcrA (membrane-fusion protein)
MILSKRRMGRSHTDPGQGRGWAAGLVVVVLLLLSGCDGSDADGAPAPTTVEAGRQYLEIIVEAAGELEPLRTVEVMSKASGEVIQVLVAQCCSRLPTSRSCRYGPS